MKFLNIAPHQDRSKHLVQKLEGVWHITFVTDCGATAYFPTP